MQAILDVLAFCERGHTAAEIQYGLLRHLAPETVRRALQRMLRDGNLVAADSVIGRQFWVKTTKPIKKAVTPVSRPG